MTQLGQRIYEMYGSGISKIGVHLIESKEEIKIGNDYSKSAVPKDARVVITHKVLCSRKGDSNTSYAVMKFVDKNTVVIVDEVDDYIRQQTKTITLNGRFVYKGKGNKSTGMHQDECPANNMSGKCETCIFKKSAHSYGYNYHQVLELSKRTKISDGDNYKELTIHGIDGKSTGGFQIGTYNITSYEQQDSLNSPDYDGKEEDCDFETYTKDLFESSFRPTKFVSHPTSYGTPISRESVING